MSITRRWQRTDTATMYQSKQRGFAGYVLVVIAMISMAAFALAKMATSGGQERWNFDTKTAILDQSKIIRSRVIACGISYPSGDNGTGYRVRFPATPVSGLVADLTCPGQAVPNNLWTGVGGVPLRSVPGGFAGWTYANDGTSMRISIQTTGGTSDMGAVKVLNQVAKSIGGNASLSGSVLTIVLMI